MEEYESVKKLITAFKNWEKDYSEVSNKAKLKDNDYIHYIDLFFNFYIIIIKIQTKWHEKSITLFIYSIKQEYFDTS